MRKSATILGICGAIGAFVWATSFSSVTVAAQGAPAAVPAALPVAAQYRGVLDKYCVTCHNEKLRTAGLAFDSLDLANLEPHADVWEKVVRKLRGGDMPPAGRPRPDQATYDAFVGWLEGSLDKLAAARPNPGAPLLHRLNRTEYGNAIRDLLALDIDVATLLPADNLSHGFDNVADGLGMSPLLLESYVVAGRKISRLAVGNPAAQPLRETYRAPYDETQDSYQQGMPLGTRGGLRVRHIFAADGEYEFRVHLQRSHQDRVRGLQDPHDLEVSVDGVQIKVFKLEGGAKMYEQAYYDADSPSHHADENLVVRAPIKAGPHEVIATFPVKTSALSEGVTRPLIRSYRRGEDYIGLPAVSQVVITGPYNGTGVDNTPSRARIFTCRPAAGGAREERACAQQIISTLARRAYRGVVAADDVPSLLGFYDEGRKNGGFERGIETALWRILASPKFVYRFEFDPPAAAAPGAAYRIGDLELASRLSFFLWSSIPDDQLLEVASRGQLLTPAVLERQVRRMLADTKARALVDNFVVQWLNLRGLDAMQPDLDEFPNFDNNLRRAFRQETELLFESIIREDRSVLDLLNADYTFVNERLALHYGIPDVRGSHFRRVPVTDENRRGLLGQGSILTATSYANRTSPVLRGKWVLDNILGMPPPPPPANVPQLPESGEAAARSMREQMAQHRANAVCASCHSKMDPLGLGLENFNAVGLWRSASGGHPIDASGTLPNGTPFDGPAGLRKALVAHPEAFVHTATSKLLTYAVGRGLAYYDEPAIRTIMRDADRRQYAFSSLVLGVVRSTPFQWRQAVGENPPAVSKTAANR